MNLAKTNPLRRFFMIPNQQVFIVLSIADSGLTTASLLLQNQDANKTGVDDETAYALAYAHTRIQKYLYGIEIPLPGPPPVDGDTEPIKRPNNAVLVALSIANSGLQTASLLLAAVDMNDAGVDDEAAGALKYAHERVNMYVQRALWGTKIKGVDLPPPWQSAPWRTPAPAPDPAAGSSGVVAEG
jgi:hypothetical protein